MYIYQQWATWQIGHVVYFHVTDCPRCTSERGEFAMWTFGHVSKFHVAMATCTKPSGHVATCPYPRG